MHGYEWPINSSRTRADTADGTTIPVPFTIMEGEKVMAHLQLINNTSTKIKTIRLNADGAYCFLYSTESNLPAPPVDILL